MCLHFEPSGGNGEATSLRGVLSRISSANGEIGNSDRDAERENFRLALEDCFASERESIRKIEEVVEEMLRSNREIEDALRACMARLEYTLLLRN